MPKLWRIARSICLLAWLASPNWALAEEIRIVTWNAKDLLRESDVIPRAADFRRFAETSRPDILLLQEVTSRDIVLAVQREMGLTGFHVAISDFAPGDRANRGDFEVAILSRFPLDEVVEAEFTPNDPNKPDHPDDIQMPRPSIAGLPNRNPARGFLWARIDSLSLSVATVHLKSSLGRTGCSDTDNAEKREVVVAGFAEFINGKRAAQPEFTHLIGGDFNVGHSDSAKLGTSLVNDCCQANCAGQDRYDETHALLSEGLIGDLSMTNLALSIPDSTFPGFPGSPIDNIYVIGPGLTRFSDAAKAAETFGSDHLPVFTQFETGESGNSTGSFELRHRCKCRCAQLTVTIDAGSCQELAAQPCEVLAQGSLVSGQLLECVRVFTNR